MTVSNYQNLIVWRKAMNLAKEVYAIAKLLPKEELYALSDQMRRSVVSNPSNIAEGCGRESKTQMTNFLRIAKGSAAELETQLLLCKEIGFVDEMKIKAPLAMLDEISRMIRSLMQWK